MRGLKDKAAIVTGAAQGIGKAIAERLTEEGCEVLWADIDAQKVMQAQMNTGKGIAMKACFFLISDLLHHGQNRTMSTVTRRGHGFFRSPSHLRCCRAHYTMQVDISKEAEVRQMVARAAEAFGRLDILINNAARFVFNHVTEVTEEGNC
jgi:meso-butanediol dehydrogenase/(S,S)-butanediol dehydrogenase/diacetyl reductase